MKLELTIFGITAFLIVNTYYDGKYTKMLKVGKKYLKMATYAFMGLTLYLFIKRHPDKSRGMLAHANHLIRFMPVDKNTADLITPLFDLTNGKGIHGAVAAAAGPAPAPQTKRMLNSGGASSKRSVSETKKKYVAAQQDWKCAHCHQQLPASFEVDHKVSLKFGGTNHISNLAALCRNCHGEKTARDNLQ